MNKTFDELIKETEYTEEENKIYKKVKNHNDLVILKATAKHMLDGRLITKEIYDKIMQNPQQVLFDVYDWMDFVKNEGLGTELTQFIYNNKHKLKYLGEDYLKKCDFKNFEGCFYIERYDDGEERGRCKIYDENKNYFDYLSLDGVTKEEFDEEVKYMQEMKDVHDFFEYFCQSYDCTDTLEDMANEIVEEYSEGGTADEEDIKDFEKEVKSDIINETFFETYDVNVFGNHYFRGNW